MSEENVSASEQAEGATAPHGEDAQGKDWKAEYERREAGRSCRPRREGRGRARRHEGGARARRDRRRRRQGGERARRAALPHERGYRRGEFRFRGLR